jgi:hypothetical protein
MPGRYGQVRRAWVAPKASQTPNQLLVRSRLSTHARAYDALTSSQQDAWSTAAQAISSRSRLGQSGPLTGLQFFTKINCTLSLLGEDPVDVPPSTPVFGALAPQNLLITNAIATGIKLALTCPTSVGENTILSATLGQGSGTRRPVSWRVLGSCPAAVAGSSNITALYTARYGLPQVGDRVFVSAKLMVNGFYGPESVFSALVPEAT